MLQSIEERMEYQLLEKESKRFILEGVVHRTVDKNTHNTNLYTAGNFEAQLNELYLEKLKDEFESRQYKEWLRALILQTPNDQELGAAIREWYNKTEGKFI